MSGTLEVLQEPLLFLLEALYSKAASSLLPVSSTVRTAFSMLCKYVPKPAFGHLSPPPYVLPFISSLANFFTLWDHKTPEIRDLLNFIFPLIHCTWKVLNKPYLISFKIMCLFLPGALFFLFKPQHPLNPSVNVLCSL